MFPYLSCSVAPAATLCEEKITHFPSCINIPNRTLSSGSIIYASLSTGENSGVYFPAVAHAIDIRAELYSTVISKGFENKGINPENCATTRLTCEGLPFGPDVNRGEKPLASLMFERNQFIRSAQPNKK